MWDSHDPPMGKYLGMTLGETIRTWSAMETLRPVTGIGCVLLSSLVV
jgi:H+/gluconate symporter-like permease